MSTNKLSAPRVPTLVEVWAPWCTECRAMASDVETVSALHAGEVETVLLDASEHPEQVRSLGVKGTPTFLGFLGGEEVFRLTGRQSRADLEALYGSLMSGAAPEVGSVDRRLRSLTAAALLGLGLATGPSWPLVVAGAGLALWATATRHTAR